MRRPVVTDLTDLDAELHNEKLDRYTVVGEISDYEEVASPTNAGHPLLHDHVVDYETEEDDGGGLTSTASNATEQDLHITSSLDSWLNQMKSKSYGTDDDESSKDSPRKKPRGSLFDFAEASPIPEGEDENQDADPGAGNGLTVASSSMSRPKSRLGVATNMSSSKNRNDAVSVRSTKSFATYATNRSTIARSVKSVPVKSSPLNQSTPVSSNTSRPNTLIR
jgi:hypothetical protein